MSGVNKVAVMAALAGAAASSVNIQLKAADYNPPMLGYASSGRRKGDGKKPRHPSKHFVAADKRAARTRRNSKR